MGNTSSRQWETGQLCILLDVSAMIASGLSAGIAISGVNTADSGGIVPAIVWAGRAAAVWGLARSSWRLVHDQQQGKHWRTIDEVEEASIGISISLVPIGIVSYALNSVLINGATSGWVCSSLIRHPATMVNYLSVGVQGVLLMVEFVNLMRKEGKKEIRTLDVIRFSMAVCMLSHSMKMPWSANEIIANTQTAFVQQYRGSLTDEQALATFDRFLVQNTGDIWETLKIVHSLMKISAPDKFFKALFNVDHIAVGKVSIIVSME